MIAFNQEQSRQKHNEACYYWFSDKFQAYYEYFIYFRKITAILTRQIHKGVIWRL